MELRSVIVEDEKVSREILRNYLSKYCPQVKVIGEAATIEEARVIIRNNDLDLLFLDVEMPFGNAFDLLESIGTINFETIFVTAYDQYALEALNNHAAYYLLKPISIDDLIKAVDYVAEVKKSENTLNNSVSIPSKTDQQKITIPTLDGFEVIDISSIVYCQADDNYTHMILSDKKRKLVSKTLKYFEDALKDRRFVRIHKSYLVNMDFVVHYKKGKGGIVVLSGGQELAVSSTKKRELLDYFK